MQRGSLRRCRRTQPVECWGEGVCATALHRRGTVGCEREASQLRAEVKSSCVFDGRQAASCNGHVGGAMHIPGQGGRGATASSKAHACAREGGIQKGCAGAVRVRAFPSSRHAARRGQLCGERSCSGAQPPSSSTMCLGQHAPCAACAAMAHKRPTPASKAGQFNPEGVYQTGARQAGGLLRPGRARCSGAAGRACTAKAQKEDLANARAVAGRLTLSHTKAGGPAWAQRETAHGRPGRA